MKSKESAGRQSFTKGDRLLKRRTYVQLGIRAKKLQDRYFIVLFDKSDSDRCRLGVTVSRRVGKAVTRNRIKRLSREFFRKNRRLFENTWDIHVIAKRAASDCENEAVLLSLERLLKKIDVFTNN